MDFKSLYEDARFFPGIMIGIGIPLLFVGDWPTFGHTLMHVGFLFCLGGGILFFICHFTEKVKEESYERCNHGRKKTRRG